jgi:carboxyl-terminal processing protease
MGMTRIAWIAVGLVLGFVSGGLVCGRQILSVAYGAEDTATYRDLESFGNAMEVLHTYYLRPVEDGALIGAAIQGMVSHLDPHSRYIDVRYAKNSQIETQSDFGGVGIEVQPEAGLIGVVSIIHGTPAAQSGIKAGDRIEAIDGMSIEGLSGDEAIDRMRGPAGSPLTLTLVRAGEKYPFTVTLTRGPGEGDAVRQRREGNVGYIRLPRFGAHAAEDLEQAVRALRQRPGIKSYVLDLRDNPGGSLDQAIRVADDFLESGEIVSVHGRDPADTRRFDAKPGDIAGGMPLVVLIDSGTAAAAEIVCGALQDHKRATVIGMTSSGNGSAQTIFPLAGFPLAGGAIGLTTSFYFTPSGRAIQDSGVVPDIAVAEGDWDDVPVIEPVIVGDEQGDEERGRLPVVRAAPGTRYDDFQLSYALDLLRGQKTVASHTSRPVEQIILYFTVRSV